ncbi:MAG: hypothetical protein LUO79_02120 [Methanomassiliicoccales archaeon]|nr:hypothetical protein [Methanomassiliicoccales archaeon]
MTEVVTDPSQAAAPDSHPMEEPKKRLAARQVLKIVGFVLLGVLLLLIVLGVFRYLLVREYGGF